MVTHTRRVVDGGGVAGGRRTRGIGRTCCYCCVCLKIVTNAPSVHFMATAINKMLQHSPPSLYLPLSLSHTENTKKTYMCVYIIYVQIIWESFAWKGSSSPSRSPRTAAGCQTNNNINFVSYILWVYRYVRECACVCACVCVPSNCAICFRGQATFATSWEALTTKLKTLLML